MAPDGFQLFFVVDEVKLVSQVAVEDVDHLVPVLFPGVVLH